VKQRSSNRSDGNLDLNGTDMSYVKSGANMAAPHFDIESFRFL